MLNTQALRLLSLAPGMAQHFADELEPWQKVDDAILLGGS